MYHIEIHLQGSEKFSEFPPETCLEMECAVENIVGCSLLQIFDTLAIINVTVRYVPIEQEHTISSLSAHNA